MGGFKENAGFCLKKKKCQSMSEEELWQILWDAQPNLAAKFLIKLHERLTTDFFIRQKAVTGLYSITFTFII